MEARFFYKSKDGRTIYTTDDQFIYAERDGVMHRLDLFEGRYYKLRPWKGVPILEIDGLRMQLVRDFDTPLDYAKKVVDSLRIPATGKANILDTCMGLGYTAIEASKRPGVSSVITCEVSDAVMTLARWNPFSEDLFAEGGKGVGKIDVRAGSIVDVIKEMPDSSFDFIIHDPPRFSHAPDLYSLDFYREVKRVCRKGARIFHYCGSVGKGRGRDIALVTGEKLAQAGFKRIKASALLQGVSAYAP